MRYLILCYMKRANGQMDEVMTVSNRIRDRDLQQAAVILDFRDLRVIKASLEGTTVPKDFDRIVGFYHQYYANTINRLFRENGYEVSEERTTEEPSHKDPVSELSADAAAHPAP